MKVIAFNGSARKNGNTAILLKTALAELGQEPPAARIPSSSANHRISIVA